MRSRRSLVILAALLALVPAAAHAGGKSHVNAAPEQILNLRAGAINNGLPLPMKIDLNGPNFVVPAGYSFVVTDVQIHSTGSLASSEVFLVFVNFDNSGSRYPFASFTGAGWSQSFTTGFVMPAGTTPTVINMAGSDAGVVVGVQGYLIKAPAAPVDAAPF